MRRRTYGETEADRQGWPRRSVVVLLALSALVAAVVGVALDTQPTPSPSEPGERDDNLLPGVDPGQVQRILALFPDGDRWNLFPGGRLESGDLASILRDLGADAPRVALAARLRIDEQLERGFSSQRSMLHDATSYPLCWYLRENPTPETDALLAEVLIDPRRHSDTRMAAAVALCRPGARDALSALTATVLVHGRSKELRHGVLERLPRLELPLPDALDELLLQPFHRLDQTAALVLGATGRLESPTLVLQAMDAAGSSRIGLSGDEETILLSLRLVERLASQPPALLEAAAAVQAHVDGIRDRGSYPDEAEVERDWAALRTAFAASLEAHPELRDTEWERARSAYLASPRRARELASMTVESLEGAPDDAIDIVAAIVALRDGPEYAELEVEYWDRLARWLKPQVAAVEPLREKLALMQRLLVPRSQVHAAGTDPNRLQTVTGQQAGICMTWTCAFVALGDRLDLPLHGVQVPRHVFVRWDDGQLRFNVDPSSGGAMLTDAAYTTQFDARPGPRSRDLVNLTRRELVGLTLSNYASDPPGWTTRIAPEERLRLLRTAVRVDPESAYAWDNLAAVSSAFGSDHADEVLDAHSHRCSLGEPDVLDAFPLVAVGLAEEALVFVGAVRCESESERRVARIARARALRLLGRPREGLDLVRTLRDTELWAWQAKATEIACLLDIDRTAGLKRLAEEEAALGDGAEVGAAELRLELAGHYLAAPAGDQHAAQRALELLPDPLPWGPEPIVRSINARIESVGSIARRRVEAATDR